MDSKGFAFLFQTFRKQLLKDQQYTYTPNLIQFHTSYGQLQYIQGVLFGKYVENDLIDISVPHQRTTFLKISWGIETTTNFILHLKHRFPNLTIYTEVLLFMLELVFYNTLNLALPWLQLEGFHIICYQACMEIQCSSQ